MTVLHAKGLLNLHAPFHHEGALDTVLTGCLVEQTTVGDRAAVVPMLGGQARIMGTATYVLDRTYPSPHGFTVADT